MNAITKIIFVLCITVAPLLLCSCYNAPGGGGLMKVRNFDSPAPDVKGAGNYVERSQWNFSGNVTTGKESKDRAVLTHDDYNLVMYDTMPDYNREIEVLSTMRKFNFSLMGQYMQKVSSSGIFVEAGAELDYFPSETFGGSGWISFGVNRKNFELGFYTLWHFSTDENVYSGYEVDEGGYDLPSDYESPMSSADSILYSRSPEYNSQNEYKRYQGYGVFASVFFDKFSINYSNLIAFNGIGIFQFTHGVDAAAFTEKGSCESIYDAWTFTQHVSVGYSLSERLVLRLGVLNVSSVFNEMSWAATGAVEFKMGAKNRPQKRFEPMNQTPIPRTIYTR